MSINAWNKTLSINPSRVEKTRKPPFLKISQVRWRSAELSAPMFKVFRTYAEDLESTQAKQEVREVSGGLDGQDLLFGVCDNAFIKEIGAPIQAPPGGEAAQNQEQPSTVMQRHGFLPVGIAKDAELGGQEAIYVFVRGFEHADVPPYVGSNLWNHFLSVVGRHVGGRYAVVLVGIDPTVLSLAINYLHFQEEIPVGPEASRAAEPLSVDPQHGEEGAIKKARGWLWVSIVKRASDIHVEPMDGRGRIRVRVDGELEPLEENIPNGDLLQMVTWIKAQSRMDIAEHRKPLDGSMRISYTDNNVQRVVDVRISTVPTIYGQKMVLRILDPNVLDKLANLGLKGAIWDSELLGKFEHALTSRDGIVLVTGPTGSGKTTTLNVSLLHLLKPGIYGDRRNIVTIEDPVEYSIPGANQIQVNEAAGVTFAKTLRAFLRQDPDIVLVGEIRDQETAQVAVQAALTGHLILATLHTNDALGAVSRLKDLQVSPFLIGATLRLVQAQRLVRKLCAYCGRQKPLAGEDLLRKVRASRLAGHLPFFEASDARVYEPASCARCQFKGYDGRAAVMEMAVSSPELVVAIEKEAPLRELERIAMEVSGFFPMARSGVKMVCAGLTTLTEIETVCAVG